MWDSTHLRRGGVEGHTEDGVRVSVQLVEEPVATEVIYVGLEVKGAVKHGNVDVNWHSIKSYINQTIC